MSYDFDKFFQKIEDKKRPQKKEVVPEIDPRKSSAKGLTNIPEDDRPNYHIKACCRTCDHFIADSQERYYGFCGAIKPDNFPEDKYKNRSEIVRAMRNKDFFDEKNPGNDLEHGNLEFAEYVRKSFLPTHGVMTCNLWELGWTKRRLQETQEQLGVLVEFEERDGVSYKSSKKRGN